MKVVAVYSTKGGVGKTTTAVNLAWEAAREFRVLLWDLDPQGAATFLLQVKPKVKGGVGALVSGDTKVGDVIRSTSNDALNVIPGDASYRDLDLVFDSAKKSERRVARILEKVADDYDVVILDCPPGASLVAENALFSADAVVVPLVPSPLSMRRHREPAPRQQGGHRRRHSGDRAGREDGHHARPDRELRAGSRSCRRLRRPVVARAGDGQAESA